MAKKTVSYTLDKDVVDVIEANTDNKSQYINDILKNLLVNNQTLLAYCQSRNNGANIPWGELFEKALEDYKVKVDRLNNIRTITGLGGDPIPGTTETPSRVGDIKDFIIKNRPGTWSEVREAFPTVVINEDLFRGSQPPLQRGHYTKMFLNSINVVELTKGGLQYV